jgi:hypothetical protein
VTANATALGIVDEITVVAIGKAVSDWKVWKTKQALLDWARWAIKVVS